jgi:hypothetical protein
MANEEQNPPAMVFKSLPLKPPESFSFIPEEWPKNRIKICRWFKITEASNMTVENKRETLLYMMGDKHMTLPQPSKIRSLMYLHWKNS